MNKWAVLIYGLALLGLTFFAGVYVGMVVGAAYPAANCEPCARP